MPRHSVKESECIILKKKRYGVGISWDTIGKVDVDLDLQCVVVDKGGNIIDAVYYNNISSFSGAVASVGDNATGAAEGVDEQIWVQLDKLPKTIHLLIFVIAAYKNGHLADAYNGKILIMEQSLGYTLKTLKIERSAADADVVAIFKRHPSDNDIWTMHEVEMPATVGSHFLDILEPNIGDIIRKEIKHAPAHQKVAFVMEKGAVSDLPMNDDMKRLFIGIGGDLPADAEEDVDLDISVIFLSANGDVVGAVDAEHTNMFGVSHSGDETVAGESDMDDEAVSMDMRQIPKNVEQIFIVMTCKQGDFSYVEKVYARVADNTAKEMARFHIAGGVKQNGLAIGRIFRSNGRWGFQAMGKFVRGTDWKEAMPMILALFHEPTREVVGKRQLLKQPKKESVSPRREEAAAAEPASAAATQPASQPQEAPETPAADEPPAAARAPEIESGQAANAVAKKAFVVTSSDFNNSTTVNCPSGTGTQSVGVTRKAMSRAGTLKLTRGQSRKNTGDASQAVGSFAYRSEEAEKLEKVEPGLDVQPIKAAKLAGISDEHPIDDTADTKEQSSVCGTTCSWRRMC